MGKKGVSTIMRTIGAACGATGFIFLGIGGTTNAVIGEVLIGIGAALIAAGA